MDNDNRYRQLLSLILLSTARGAVEYLTNPDSREDAGNQLKSAFAEIDYDAAAKAVVSAIDSLADTSKERLADTIDILRDRSVDVVDDAKSKVQKQSGQKSGGRLPLLFAVVIGGLLAYFLFDEQRRDDLLDRITGASGPIEQNAQSVYQQASSAAQQAASNSSGSTQQVHQDIADAASDTTQL